MARRNLALGGSVPMEAGLRDRCVTIEQAADSAGSSGHPVETWTPLCTLWAFRDDLRASERFAAQQVASRVEVRWEVNYRADLDPEQVDVTKTRRLVWQGRPYDITGASVIGRREGIELLTMAAGRVS